MKANTYYKTLLATAVVFAVNVRCGVTSEFTATPQPSVTKGNLKDSSIGGNVTQTFSETRHVAQETSNQGGAGGSAHIHLGGEMALDPFEEGRRYFLMVPPDYAKAETYFLRAAGAEAKHIKISSYLHCAKCVWETNPGGAVTYYENVLQLEPHDEAHRGLMQLDYALATDVEEDTEYFEEVLTRALTYGKQIRRQNKDDLTLIKEIAAKLSALSLPQSTPVAISAPHPVVDQKPSAMDMISPSPQPSPIVSIDYKDDADLSTLSNDSSNPQVEELAKQAKKGVKKARITLETMAIEGDFDAAIAMIDLYTQGLVVKKNVERIFFFTCQAAEAGNVDYQFKVAKAYQAGEGTIKDSDEAIRFYQLAAHNDHREALYELAKIYGDTSLAVHNHEKAVAYYTRAAQQGVQQAIVELAELYATSAMGLSSHQEAAQEWYIKAGDQGTPEVWLQLGNLYTKGTSSISANEATAFSWYEKAALAGQADAIRQVVDYYIDERLDLASQSLESIEWYQKGASMGYERALMELIEAYHNQIGGLTPTSADAMLYVKQGADLGNETALVMLVDHYLTLAASADHVHYYTHAASKGHKEAQVKLGELYQKGMNVPIDAKAAKEWFLLAANQGDARALTVIQSGVLDAPEFARGYEAIYNRFINGKLLFDNGEGQRKEFSFNAFADTLTGEFDLSGLRYEYENQMYDVNQYLRIKVGVRTTKENEEKTTIWFTPKFMVDRLTSHPWKDIAWSSDVGVFWSYGQWDLRDFAYLTRLAFDEISSQNLLKLYGARRLGPGGGVRSPADWAVARGLQLGESRCLSRFLTKFE